MNLIREIIGTQTHIMYVGIMKTENKGDTIWLIKPTNFTLIVFWFFFLSF